MKNFKLMGALAVAIALVAPGCKKEENKPAAKPTDPKAPATPDKGATTPTPTPDKGTATPTPDKGTATPVAGTGSVTITHTVPKVGAVWTEDDTMTMDAKFSVQGHDVAMTNTESKKKKIEALEVSPEAVTKAKITYTEYSKVQNMGGKEKAEGAPAVGKTYVLELKDGKVTVTADGGGEVSAEESELVLDDNKKFGKADEFDHALNGMTFKMGEKTVIPAEKLGGLFGGDGEMQAANITMTLVEMQGTNAVFDMEVTLKGAKGPLNMEMALKAKGLVDPANSRLLDLTMDGSLTFSGQATGAGTMKGHKSAQY